MSPRALLALIRGAADKAPYPIRQVIAETMSVDVETLDLPMGRATGRWVHVAIATGEWARPSTLPWATSAAPTSGRRRYIAV
jgi:hypothetical protein